LDKISAYLFRISLGEFSVRIPLSKKDDIFNEFIASLNLLFDDLEDFYSGLKKEIAQSKIKFKMYLDNSPLAIFVANEKGEYVYNNKAAVALLGYSLEEFLHLKVSDLTREDKKENSRKSFKEVLKKGYFTNEFSLKHKNGKYVLVKLTALKMPDNQVIAICEDIGPRKKFEKELEEKIKETEKLNKFMVGRELKMIELKKEIKRLRSLE